MLLGIAILGSLLNKPPKKGSLKKYVVQDEGKWRCLLTQIVIVALMNLIYSHDKKGRDVRQSILETWKLLWEREKKSRSQIWIIKISSRLFLMVRWSVIVTTDSSCGGFCLGATKEKELWTINPQQLSNLAKNPLYLSEHRASLSPPPALFSSPFFMS